MAFEIWDAETANILGTFDAEDEAWEALGRALAEHGPDYVASLVLGVEDDSGDSRLIASGPELVKRTTDRLHASEAVPSAARAVGASD